MFWMITNRNVEANGFGGNYDKLTFWRNDAGGDLKLFRNWTNIPKADDFLQALAQRAAAFPTATEVSPEDQSHVTLFVHGFDNSWTGAVDRYGQIVANLFSGAASLGECILFTWPSKGAAFEYLPDRSEARQASSDLADVLSGLYDHMASMQRLGASDASKACKAKTSLIAHSMGNYVVQNAMNFAWTRQNRPLLMSLMNQCLMVAADVDNDIFKSGEAVGQDGGEGIANLTYRVTALYSGRDAVLGTSAGLKHFGKRRLGRSGIDRTTPVPDNVWDIDCSGLIPDSTSGISVHGAYFEEPKCYALMRELLRGIDRTVLLNGELIPASAPKSQVAAS